MEEIMKIQKVILSCETIEHLYCTKVWYHTVFKQKYKTDENSKGYSCTPIKLDNSKDKYNQTLAYLLYTFDAMCSIKLKMINIGEKMLINND